MGSLYDILEVSENFTEEELKLSYRRLAKKYHPDSHPQDKECEKRFQEISEAYDILSNTEKRKKYDRERRKQETSSGMKKNGTGQADRGRTPHSSGVDFENIHKSFEQFFGFNPKTHTVTNEEKINPNSKNPLDTTDMFERFMGIKR
ncbi:MAG: J domain-containing protein [Lachnospiraceae bacterium]